jgi:hypothetical protein
VIANVNVLYLTNIDEADVVFEFGELDHRSLSVRAEDLSFNTILDSSIGSPTSEDDGTVTEANDVHLRILGNLDNLLGLILLLQIRTTFTFVGATGEREES